MPKVSYSQLGIEFVSVVFAVLLALGLNAFKQSMDARAEASLIKASIIAECRNNYAKVDTILINNQDFANYLDSLVSLDPKDVRGITFNYSFELLTNAAWEIAQNNSSVNNLDQKFLLDAADIYHAQEFYTDFASSFFQNVGTYLNRQDNSRPYNTALSFYFNVKVMNNSADDLIEKYQRFLENYSKE